MSRNHFQAMSILAAALLLSGCLGLTGSVDSPPVGVAVDSTVESAPASGDISGATSAPVEGAGASSAPAGKVYGDGVSLAGSVPISEILDNVDAYAGKSVRIEGLITGVCENRGCWIDLAGDREFETLRVKVEDGVIVFPMEVRGKYAVAEGVVTKLDADQPHGEGEGQHMAEGQGDGDGEGEHAGGGGGHAGAEGMVVRLDATGAVIRDRP